MSKSKSFLGEVMETYINKENLTELTKDLVESINSFSTELPDDEVYALRRMLCHSVNHLPEVVEEASKMTGKMSIIRGMIKLNSNLEECKNYLSMAEKLKFAKTNDIVRKVDEFSLMINNTLSAAI